MNGLIERIDHAVYPGMERRWDDELFRERVLAEITEEAVILDMGAGAGVVPQMNFRNRASKVCGIDMDPRVIDNPFLDEGVVADATTIPYAPATFDVVFSDNVLEHLVNPAAVFSELYRVLKSHGVFLFKTPNRWHYMPLIASVTPHSFHRVINRKRGRADIDTFPTRYRANTVRAVRRLAARSGFEVVYLDRIEGRPEYTRISWPTYCLGVTYERIVNSTRWLEPFRILLVGKLCRKPSSGIKV